MLNRYPSRSWRNEAIPMSGSECPGNSYPEDLTPERLGPFIDPNG